MSQREKELEVPTGSFGLQGGLHSAPICMLIRSQDLRQQFVEYAVKPFAVKIRRFAFLPASTALSLGSVVSVTTHLCLLRTASLFGIVLWDSWRQALLAIRTRQSGGHLSGGSYKSWGARHVMCISSFQTDDSDPVLLLEQARGRRWGKCLPAPQGSGMGWVAASPLMPAKLEVGPSGSSL